MRKHNYVVGYTGEGQCAYGKRGLDEGCGWVNLMTLKQAQKLSEEIVSLHGKKTITSIVYKLVEVKSEEEQQEGNIPDVAKQLLTLNKIVTLINELNVEDRFKLEKILKKKRSENIKK